MQVDVGNLSKAVKCDKVEFSATWQIFLLRNALFVLLNYLSRVLKCRREEVRSVICDDCLEVCIWVKLFTGFIVLKLLTLSNIRFKLVTNVCVTKRMCIRNRKSSEKNTEEETYSCSDLDRSRKLQELQAPRILRQSAHESGKGVSPTHRPPLPPMEDPWYSLMLEAESTPGL